MTEKQLIAKLQEFRQIKPKEDWVIFTKSRIFAAEETNRDRVSAGFSFFSFLREIQRGERYIFQHKPALATVLCVAVLIGLFGFTQSSLPGDTLFPIKRIKEISQAVFVPNQGQSKYNLELANKRLDDLTKVVETNSAKNLGPAINEFQASVSKAAKSLAGTEVKKDPTAVKEIALEVKKLEEKADKIKSLGVEIGESEELNNALATIYEEYKITVESEIKDLESRTLTEEQKEILAQVKEDYEKGNYGEALEKILLLSQ